MLTDARRNQTDYFVRWIAARCTDLIVLFMVMDEL